MESKKNEQLILMQREQEVMKNNSIKEMIRQQKLMAEEKKDAVSTQYLFKLFDHYRNAKKKDFNNVTD